MEKTKTLAKTHLSKEEFDRVDFSPQAKVPFKDKLVYASTGYSSYAPWQALGYYLMFFYTDVIGFSASFAGFIMLFARIFDAGTDLLIGWAIDRFNFKWGKYRSWIRFGIAPSIVLFIMCFSSIPGATAFNLIMAWVGYGCFGAIGQTLCFIPMNAQLTNMTKNVEERASITGMKGFFTNGGTLLVAATYPPLVDILGGSQGNLARGFFLTTLIVAVTTFFPLFLNYRRSEKYELNHDGTYRAHIAYAAENKVNLLTALKSLFTNRPAMVTVLGVLVMYAMEGVRTGSIVYLYEYYFEMPELTSIALVFNGVLAILGALLIKPFVKLFKDSNRAYIVTIFANAVVFLGFYLIASSMEIEAARASMYYGPLFFYFAFCGLLQGAHYMFATAILPNTVDYGIWKTGQNQAGFIFAVFGFALTFGAALGGQVLGLLLDGIGYVPGVTQAGTALSGILMVAVFAPAVMAVLHGVIQLFYGLNDKKLAKYVEETNAKALKENANQA